MLSWRPERAGQEKTRLEREVVEAENKLESELDKAKTQSDELLREAQGERPGGQGKERGRDQ